MIQTTFSLLSYLIALVFITWSLMMSVFLIDAWRHGSLHTLQQLEHRLIENKQLKQLFFNEFISMRGVDSSLKQWKLAQKNFNHWLANYLPSLLPTAQFIEAFLYALFLTLMLILQRCLLLFLYLPILFFSIISASIDGLSHRYIRTACLARESSSRHETARRSLKGTALIAATLWLVFPFEELANIFLAITTLLLSVMSFYVCQSFKKYY